MATVLTPREHRSGFAKRLKATRLKAGHDTKASFARELSVKVVETYRRYERGETEPDIALLNRIHEVTGVDLNWLIAGQEPRTAHRGRAYQTINNISRRHPANSLQ